MELKISPGYRETLGCGTLTGIPTIAVLKSRVVVCWSWWHTINASTRGTEAGASLCSRPARGTWQDPV